MLTRSLLIAVLITTGCSTRTGGTETALADAQDGTTPANSPIDGSALPQSPSPEETQPTVCETVTVVGSSFATGSAELDDAAVTRLAELAAGLDGHQVEVVGHTDSTPVEGGNQLLSERRAAAVANVLHANGVDDGTIRSSGRADSEPIDDSDTADAKAKNRRVEIRILCDQTANDSKVNGSNTTSAVDKQGTP